MFDSLKKLFRKDSGKDSAQPLASGLASPEQWLFDALWGGVSSSSGMRVTPEKAMGVATVFACVNLLSRAVGTLPLKIYRRSTDGESVEIARNHAVYSLIHDAPNPEMSSADFRMTMQFALSLHNNAYAEIVFGGDGRPREIWPIHPAFIQKKRDGRGIYYDVTDEDTGEVRQVSTENILHIRGLSPNGLVGMNILSAVRDVVGLAMALDTNLAKFFANGSRPGLILDHPSRLSGDAKEFLKKQIEERYQGADNSYRVMILQEGMKAATLRETNNDAQMAQQAERVAKQICAVFGVPPYKVGIIDNIPRANAEELNRDFNINTLRPIAVVWEQQMNRALLVPRERARYFIEFDLKGLERGSLKDRYASYALGRQWGWLSVNDIRKAENMNPVENGDIYLEPLNMQEAGSEPEPPDPPEPPTDPEEEEDEPFDFTRGGRLPASAVSLVGEPRIALNHA